MRVSVTDLKNQLSKYLRLVKQGETVEIVEHSVPIVRLQKISTGSAGSEAHLGRLARDGIVSPASRKAAEDLVSRPPVPCSVDAVEVLIEQRGDR